MCSFIYMKYEQINCVMVKVKKIVCSDAADGAGAGGAAAAAAPSAPRAAAARAPRAAAPRQVQPAEQPRA